MRTVFYDLHDPDKLEAAQHDLAQKVDAIEANPADVRNPITVARNATLLQQSDDPEIQAAGAVLSAVNELRDEMRGLLRRQAEPARPAGSAGEARMAVRTVFERSGEQLTTEQVAALAGTPLLWTEELLHRWAKNSDIHIYAVDGKWSAIPF